MADAIPSAERRPSIAVLPFDDLSGDTGLVSLGLTEEITLTLASLRDLFVISSGSVRGFHGRNLSEAAVGRLLSVRYLLRGSIQRVGSKLRIYLELLDAETNEVVHSKRCDILHKDIFHGGFRREAQRDQANLI